ncbi:hypothetical protein BYT27DRAFT_7191823 [Phlegmacium glaucopus]|nr:hypothetical protein BYT27DRAFT_7191823 [Phlegmacium glaucopus]
MSLPDDNPQRLASPQSNGNLGLGFHINIYCHSVIVERPPTTADHPNPVYRSTPPPLNGVWVRSGGISDFIRTLYWNILGRNPENQLAIDNWTRHTYTHGLAHTVGSFFTAEEYTSKGMSTESTVDKLYLAVLGRQVTATGRGDWVERIRNGMSLWQVAEGFVDSAEYRGKVQAGTAPDPIHWPAR